MKTVKNIVVTGETADYELLQLRQNAPTYGKGL